MPTASALHSPPVPAPRSLWQRRPRPLGALRRRVSHWWQARLPQQDSLTLTQRNVYILPTRAGWMFGLTLLVLLLGSINYQLSLGYVLTFLLAGSAVVSMHITHGTLRGLVLHLRPPSAVFAGESTPLHIALTSPRGTRYGIGLRRMDEPDARSAWCDIAAAGHGQLQLSIVVGQRGQHPLPTLVIHSRFPLGLFRAWAIWRPAAQVLAYPQPERPAPPLPTAADQHGAAGQRSVHRSSEAQGIRPYRAGDPLKLIAWKKSASTLARNGELVSRDTLAQAPQTLQLHWQQSAGLDDEARLSRLCAWVLRADAQHIDYGLQLPRLALAPGQGEAHRNQCLQALARWPDHANATEATP